MEIKKYLEFIAYLPEIKGLNCNFPNIGSENELTIYVKEVSCGAWVTTIHKPAYTKTLAIDALKNAMKVRFASEFDDDIYAFVSNVLEDANMALVGTGISVENFNVGKVEEYKLAYADYKAKVLESSSPDDNRSR